MSTSFAQRVSIPDSVMFRELEGESVILDLGSDSYFGLDQIGTKMWQALTEADSIQAAYDVLLEEYEVEADTLRADLSELLDTLLARGLIKVASG